MDARHIAMTVVVALSVLCMSVRAAELELPLTDDAWINGNAATTNYGAATTLNVHNYGPKFSLVRFDASTIAGKTVTKARLTIFVGSVGAPGQLTIYPVVSSWNEGTVTWTLQPPTEANAVASIDLTTAMGGSVFAIDVTSVAQRWASGALADAGFLLATVSPIKAVLQSKERVPTNPATLTITTSDADPPEPSKAIVLDFSILDNCTINAPGYYVLDRTWQLTPSGSVEPNAGCSGAIQIASSGVTIDLRGFSILRGSFGGDYEPVLRIGTASSVTLRNGVLKGIFVALEASVAGGTVTLENIRTGGAVLLANRTVTATGGSYSATSDAPLRAGAGSRVTGAVFDCSETHCLGVRGSSLVSDCVFTVNTTGPPAISVLGDDTIVVGNVFNEWISIEGNRNIVSRNFSGGGYIEVDGTGNVIDGNIGPGIAFEAPGNFYGSNRAHGAFSGIEGNVDWGGNVTY